MADQEITTLIAENLKGKDREVALFFTEFLQSQSLSLIRDRGFWKDKIYARSTCLKTMRICWIRI